MRDGTARRLSKLHRIVYQATSGRVGRRLVGNDMLLLTTRGRNTGRPHTVPLLFLRDGSDAVVVASWGGRDTQPEWFLNLVVEPRVEVRLEGSCLQAIAATMEEPERSRWWERAVAAYPGYDAYQRRTSRVIPIVRLRVAERPAESAR